jgi:hypothetical protein
MDGWSHGERGDVSTASTLLMLTTLAHDLVCTFALDPPSRRWLFDIAGTPCYP